MLLGELFCELLGLSKSLLTFTVYSPDPYVTVQVLGTPNGLMKTKHISNNSQPEWNETFQFYIDPKRDRLIEFVLYDLNRTVNEEIGREVFDFYGFPDNVENSIVISYKNVSFSVVSLLLRFGLATNVISRTTIDRLLCLCMTSTFYQLLLHL